MTEAQGPDRHDIRATSCELFSPLTIRGFEFAVLAAGVLVIILMWDQFGISWDESNRALHGEMLLEYFGSLGRRRTAVDHEQLRFYTAFPDLLAAAAYHLAPEFKYPIRHTVSALFGLATLPALFKFAELLGRRSIAPIAASILVLIPTFFGHAFVNSKDIPVACAFAWSMVGLAWLFREPTPTLRRVVVAGLAVGFPLMIRPTIWTILIAIYVATLIFVLLRNAKSTEHCSPWLWLAASGGVLLVAWFEMVAVWPWAHERPFFNPVAAIWVTSSFPLVVPVLFDGSVIASDALPHHYLLQMLLLKLPIAVTVLALVGVSAELIRVRRGMKFANASQVLALSWPMVPVVAWTLFTPNVYDGIRHFLFVLPSVALWAAIGIERIGRHVTGGWRKRRALFLLASAAVVLWPVREMVRLHPYQSTYFNELVGGLNGASEAYDTDYWLTSYREAAEWLGSFVGSDQADGSITVWVAATPISLESAKFYLSESYSVEMVYETVEDRRLPDGVDYYIGTTRFDWDSNFPDSPIVFRVGRGTADFTIVRARTGPLSPSATSRSRYGERRP